MSNKGNFSTRFGYAPAGELIREDAPAGFRYAVLALAEKDPLSSAADLLRVVRLTLGVPAKDEPFADFDRGEAQRLVESCDWWRVYEVAEALYEAAKHKLNFMSKNEQYQSDLNDYCNRHSIGWRMVGGHWQVHTSDQQDVVTAATAAALQAAGKQTTARELQQSLDDLSRRPQPDITGAIQHIGAAIECLARDVCGDPQLTLGDIIKRHPSLFPGAYRKLAEAIWGIASNRGRHIHEGGEPSLNEAFLLVGVVTPLLQYLLAEAAPAQLQRPVE